MSRSRHRHRGRHRTVRRSLGQRTVRQQTAGQRAVGQVAVDVLVEVEVAAPVRSICSSTAVSISLAFGP